jgi:hypothetical protein
MSVSPNVARHLILSECVGWDRVGLKTDENRVDRLYHPRVLDVRRGCAKVGAYRLGRLDSQQRELAAHFELQSITLPP